MTRQGQLLQGESTHGVAWAPCNLSHALTTSSTWLARAKCHRGKGYTEWHGMACPVLLSTCYVHELCMARQGYTRGSGPECNSADLLMLQAGSAGCSCAYKAQGPCARSRCSSTRSFATVQGHVGALGPTVTWGVCARTLLLAVQVWRLGARLELHVQALQGQALTHSAVPLLTVRH